jgi:hypothetical protein
MMALCPEAVGEGAADFIPGVGRDHVDFVPFPKLTPTGVWGRPGLATREKGEAALTIAAGATASYIRETFGTLSRMKNSRRWRFHRCPAHRRRDRQGPGAGRQDRDHDGRRRALSEIALEVLSGDDADRKEHRRAWLRASTSFSRDSTHAAR